MESPMQPLTSADFKAGDRYLHARVYWQGELGWARLTIISTPDEQGEFECYWTTGDPLRSEVRQTDLKDVGCLPDSERERIKQFPRIFEYTEDGQTQLKALVERQDLAGYLALIGVDVPVGLQTIQRQAAECAEFERQRPPDYDTDSITEMRIADNLREQRKKEGR